MSQMLPPGGQEVKSEVEDGPAIFLFSMAEPKYAQTITRQSKTRNEATMTSIRLASIVFLILLSSLAHADENESWVGKKIMPKKASFTMARVDEDGQEIGSIRVVSMIVVVLKEDGKRILVRQNGMEWWSTKDDAVPLDKAVSYFTERIRTNPNDGSAYAYRAAAWSENKEWVLALKDHDEAIRLKPGVAVFYNNRGNAQRVAKNYDMAIKDFDEAIRLDSKTALFFINRGIVRHVTKEYDKALTDYDEAIRLGPNVALVYYHRGLTYSENQEIDKAIADYSRSIQLDPKYVAAYVNRGGNYSDKLEYDKAIADFSEAIRLNPKYVMAYYNRGLTYSKKQEFEQAIADYTQAVLLDPKFAIAFNNRGNNYRVYALQLAQTPVDSGGPNGRATCPEGSRRYTIPPCGGHFGDLGKNGTDNVMSLSDKAMS